MSTYRVRITGKVPLVCSPGQYLTLDKDGGSSFGSADDATVFTNYGEADAWTEELPAEVEEFDEMVEQDAIQDPEIYNPLED